MNVSPSRTSSAWRRETVTSSRKSHIPASGRSACARPRGRSSPPPCRRRSGRRAPGPCPGAPGACAGVLGEVLGREGLRLLAGLALVQHGAAARTEIGGLRILEPALRAIDVAQRALFAEGALRDERMSVSCSTSTSVTPFPFIRAVRSARRMSIRPWSMRRRNETSFSSFSSSSIRALRSSSERVPRSGSGSVEPFRSTGLSGVLSQ